MKLTLLTAIVGLVVLAMIFELVRRRQLREKYAMLWLVVGLLVVPLSFFPRVLDSVAVRLGVASGVSLVLFLGVIFLLLVAVHLSWEVSRLEEETRALAEAMGLLRADMEQQVTRLERAAGSPRPDPAGHPAGDLDGAAPVGEQAAAPAGGLPAAPVGEQPTAPLGEQATVGGRPTAPEATATRLESTVDQ